jgi:serine/threonine protein kinase
LVDGTVVNAKVGIGPNGSGGFGLQVALAVTIPGTDRETALGLADAHEVGLIHRDVKPSNILLDGKTGSARLTDFGIAKALGESDLRLTATGAFVGTAAYMSPEQFDASTTLGTPSDVYSLGVVAFEVVAGELPFRGTVAQLALQHTNDPAPSLATIDGVSPALAELVDRCLSKDPLERPAARDVAVSLESIDSATETTEAPVSGSRRMRLLRFVGLLLATLALSVFAIVVKGEALVMLKALLKTLLKAALHSL